jgi:uncharacterized membrane protein YfcA
MTNEIILVLGGIIIGIIAVVLGGGNFWAMPLWQILFPDIGLGVLIGNLKVGSAFRGFASSCTTFKRINKIRVLKASLALMVGTILGASFIAKLDQSWAIVAILIAIILSESADWIGARAKPYHFIIGSIILGIYYGLFAAGSGILIVTLLRLKSPADSKIANVKSEARVVEFLMSIAAVSVHFLSGNVVSVLWIPWCIGAMLGGYIGGKILNTMGHASAEFQKFVLRVSYLLALVVSIFSF